MSRNRAGRLWSGPGRSRRLVAGGLLVAFLAQPVAGAATSDPTPDRPKNVAVTSTRSATQKDGVSVYNRQTTVTWERGEDWRIGGVDAVELWITWSEPDSDGSGIVEESFPSTPGTYVRLPIDTYRGSYTHNSLDFDKIYTIHLRAAAGWGAARVVSPEVTVLSPAIQAPDEVKLAKQVLELLADPEKTAGQKVDAVNSYLNGQTKTPGTASAQAIDIMLVPVGTCLADASQSRWSDKVGYITALAGKIVVGYGGAVRPVDQDADAVTLAEYVVKTIARSSKSRQWRMNELHYHLKVNRHNAEGIHKALFNELWDIARSCLDSSKRLDYLRAVATVRLATGLAPLEAGDEAALSQQVLDLLADPAKTADQKVDAARSYLFGLTKTPGTASAQAVKNLLRVSNSCLADGSTTTTAHRVGYLAAVAGKTVADDAHADRPPDQDPGGVVLAESVLSTISMSQKARSTRLQTVENRLSTDRDIAVGPHGVLVDELDDIASSCLSVSDKLDYLRGVATVRLATGLSMAPGPTGLTATPSDQQVELAWTAAVNSGQTFEYQVRYKETTGGSFGSWSKITDAAATSHTVTGLTNGTGYTFEVQAVYDADVSPVASAQATPRSLLRFAEDAPTSYLELLFWERGQAIEPFDLSEMRAQGGLGDLTYTLVPALPDGLALNQDTLVLSGTPTAQVGATWHRLVVTDEDDGRLESHDLIEALVFIDDFPYFHPLAAYFALNHHMETNALRYIKGTTRDPIIFPEITFFAWDCDPNSSDCQILTPVPPRGEITYNIDNLPAGLTFDSSTRTYSGAPTEVTVPEFAPFYYTATDDDGDIHQMEFHIVVVEDETPYWPAESQNKEYVFTAGDGRQEEFLPWSTGGNHSSWEKRKAYAVVDMPYRAGEADLSNLSWRFSGMCEVDPAVAVKDTNGNYGAAGYWSTSDGSKLGFYFNANDPMPRTAFTMRSYDGDCDYGDLTFYITVNEAADSPGARRGVSG